MTVAFDEKARHEMSQAFQAYNFGYDGTPISQMVVEEISSQLARKCISAFHYTHTYPDSTLVSYGGFLNNKLCGVICYGMGANKAQYTSLIPDIENGEYVELTRLWCANEYPKNTESKLIGASLKMLPKSIKLVISFADEGKGHLGTIYQATNWLYTGLSAKRNDTYQPNGLHPRSYDKDNHSDLKQTRSQKHRYVYLVGNKREKRDMRKELKYPVYDKYPKGDETRYDIHNPKAIKPIEIINKGV